MNKQECENCGWIGIPRVYRTEDKKHEAWECVADVGGCGTIYWPESWMEAEEAEEDNEVEEDEDGSDT